MKKNNKSILLGKVLLVHDQEYFAPTIAKSLRLFHKINAEAAQTALEAVQILRDRGDEFDVVIVHKDLGQYSGEPDNSSSRVIDLVHEINSAIRVGIVSGEFPDGRSHVLSLGADFYLITTGIRDEWTVEQIKKGPAALDEIASRGKSVEMLPGYSSRRERW